VGCSLATSLVARLKEFKRDTRPDFRFIEPSGMVPNLEMHHVTRLGRKEMDYGIGPFITLVEGPLFWDFGRNGSPCC